MLEFFADTHTYLLDGRRVPSVTQALDRQQDFADIPDPVLEAAGVRGRYVHEACNLLVRDDLEWASLHPTFAPFVRGAQKFLDESGFVVIESERRVCSKKLRVAGTLDVRGILNGASWTIDWKATFAFPIGVGPQTAAYDALRREEDGGRPDRRGCILLKPDSYKLYPLEDKRDLNIFISALNCYNYFWSHKDVQTK